MNIKWLVVGLGNPEGKYFDTWHNLGFRCAEVLAEHFSLEFKKKGNQLLAKADIVSENGGQADTIFVLKPLTYMNRSGEAVVALTRKQKIEAENIIVFVDDLYIDKGKIRITPGGSHAGHNGIRSISGLLGTPDYTRIKVGIKPDREPHSLSNYVLARIPNEERDLINDAIMNAVDAALLLIRGTPLAAVQAKYNSKNEVAK